MVQGAESEPIQSIPASNFFREQFGVKKPWFVFYEEAQHGLPEEFDGPDGWRCLRTGLVSGGTSRHPDDDWVSDCRLGPGRTVQLAAIFAYDPKMGEVTVKHINETTVGRANFDRTYEHNRERGELATQGWMIVPSCLDRVVGYRKLIKINQ